MPEVIEEIIRDISFLFCHQITYPPLWRAVCKRAAGGTRVLALKQYQPSVGRDPRMEALRDKPVVRSVLPDCPDRGRVTVSAWNSCRPAVNYLARFEKLR